MKRTWTIIGVADAHRSFKWRQDVACRRQRPTKTSGIVDARNSLASLHARAPTAR